MTVEIDRWRDELRLTGEVCIASSKAAAARGAALSCCVIAVGIYLWVRGIHLIGLQVIVLGTVAVATFAWIFVTQNPRMRVTSRDLQISGGSLAWSDVTQVDVQSAGRVVVLRCTDEAHAAVVDAFNRPAKFQYRFERAVGIRNRVVIPIWLEADARDLARWLTELAADRDES